MKMSSFNLQNQSLRHRLILEAMEATKVHLHPPPQFLPSLGQSQTLQETNLPMQPMLTGTVLGNPGCQLEAVLIMPIMCYIIHTIIIEIVSVIIQDVFLSNKRLIL